MRPFVASLPLLLRLLLALPLILAVGCSSGMATMKGKITYQGRPVTFGSVTVLDEDSTAHSGLIEPDGTYTVEGVHPGKVTIGVSSPDPRKSRHQRDRPKSSPTAKESGPPPPGWFPIPGHYATTHSSGLICTVTGRHFTYDIDLK